MFYMLDRLKFVWACVTDAARGTIERANAWAWLLGAFVLWMVLRWRGYELMPPDTMPGVILLGAICLVVAWIIVFLWRLFGAPYRLHLASNTEIKQLKAAIQAAPSLSGDIDARKAFFQILERSHWRKVQEENTTDTRHLVRNWLEVQLDREIHNALRNSRLNSWGEQCLQGTATTPQKPIPAETWDTVEIIFDRLPMPRTAAHFKGYTSREFGKTAWVGIRFSEKQIFELFPLLSDPLKIIFDQANPGRKFWSIESMKDESGKPVAGSFWEYRALIKNTSSKTLRNVKVTVEAIGAMPTRPEPSQFDINKKYLIDLTPDEETLVLIRRWYNPPIVAGMASGDGFYGPIKMTVSADDVMPIIKLFQFNPERTPMIFEMSANA